MGNIEEDHNMRSRAWIQKAAAEIRNLKFCVVRSTFRDLQTFVNLEMLAETGGNRESALFPDDKMAL